MKCVHRFSLTRLSYRYSRVRETRATALLTCQLSLSTREVNCLRHTVYQDSIALTYSNILQRIIRVLMLGSFTPPVTLSKIQVVKLCNVIFYLVPDDDPLRIETCRSTE